MPQAKAAASIQRWTQADGKLGIFISHRAEDGDLAAMVRDKLQLLNDGHLDIYVFEERPGGEDYRRGIEEQISNAHVFLFLYTFERDDWKWCIYEAGIFKGVSRGAQSRHLICIKNHSIGKAPSPLDNLSYYNSKKSSLRRFFDDLLYNGAFSCGMRISDDLHTQRKSLLGTACREIHNLYEEKSVDVVFFARRIGVGPISTSRGSSTPLSDARITSSIETLRLLGLRRTNLRWNHLRERFSNKEEVTWIEDLEKFFITQGSGEVPENLGADRQVMTRFSRDGRTYIPILSRIEYKDHLPQKCYVSFVEDRQDDDPYRASLDGVPSRHKAIIRLLNLARRFRWDILEPTITTMRRLDLSTTEIQEQYRNVFEHLEVLEREAKEYNLMVEEIVADCFPIEQRDSIREMFASYFVHKAELSKGFEEEDRELVLQALDALRAMNKKFLVIATMMYTKLNVEIAPVEVMQVELPDLAEHL